MNHKKTCVLCDLQGDFVLVLSLQAVLPAGDGVPLQVVPHREAVSGPHQNGVVRGPGQQGHSTYVTAAVLEGTQPGVLSLHNLPAMSLDNTYQHHNSSFANQ